MSIAAMGSVPEWTTADRCRKARELTGLEQADFAKELGCSRGTVSNYERGEGAYRRPVMLAWAMRSGVPLEWLLTGRQPTAPPPATEDTRGYYPSLRIAS